MFNVSKCPLIQRIRSARRISGAGEKLRKLYYWKETGLLFHRVETEKLIKSVKLNNYFFYRRGHVVQELIFITIYLPLIKKVLHSFRQKKLTIVNLIKIFYIFLEYTWNFQNHLCILKMKFRKFPPITQIRSALGIRGMSEKLRKLRMKSRRKAWSLLSDLKLISNLQN